MAGTMQRLLMALLGFTLFIHTMAEERDRFWSGPPQAVGIDLSPSLIHAVLATPDGNFTHLATVSPGVAYSTLMHDLFLRRQAMGEMHMAAWDAHQRWAALRAVVKTVTDVTERYRWTRWVGSWLPDVIRDEDWRYTFDASLEDGDDLQGEQEVVEKEGSKPTPLTTTKFITIIANALQMLRAQTLANHNINITSAVVAMPWTIYNQLEDLLEDACAHAGIEIFILQGRVESAIGVVPEKERKNMLVIEQSQDTFTLQQATSNQEGISTERNDLSRPWVVVRLMRQVLDQISLTDEQRAALRSDVDAQLRLYREVMMTRFHMNYAKACGVGVEEEGPVVVPGLLQGVDLDEMLRGEDIARAEESFVAAVRDEVEGFLEGNTMWANMMKARNVFGIAELDLDDPPNNYSHDHDQGLLATSAFPELSLYFKPVDAVLVLADFPDALLIAEGATQALRMGLEGPDWDGFVSWDASMVPRGAAEKAMAYVRGWPGEDQDEDDWEDEEEWEYEDEEQGESDEEHDDL